MSGTKSSYVLCGESGTQCCQMCLQCVLPPLPDQDSFLKVSGYHIRNTHANNGERRDKAWGRERSSEIDCVRHWETDPQQNASVLPLG